MNKKIATLVCFSSIPLWLLISFARKNPHLVEKYYSQLTYPIVLNLHKLFLDLIPFSFGDILYLGMTFFVIRTILKKIYFWRIKPLNLFLDIGSLLILSVWIFHISWGFNYHRLPLKEQLQIPIFYTLEDLDNCLNKIIKESNNLHSYLISSDTLAVTFPFSKEHLSKKIILYHPIYQESLLGFSKIKNSLMSLPLSYMGYSGYLNPFTLELQVNAKMPIQSLITTSLHEMAHQLGYASEKEANFIAYLSAINSKDPYIQYAGKTFAFGYLFRDLYKLNQEKARDKLKLLNPGILKNFNEVNNFWKKYENPFEIVFDKTYDAYLKLNGQKSGIKSYNEMVGLVINYHKNEEQY